MSLELLARAQACEKTIAAYAEQPYELGRRDCARMVAQHAKHMGHQITVSAYGSYTTPAGALRALRRRGYPSLEALLDRLWERIPPALVLPGDVLALPSASGVLSALVVRLDGVNCMGVYQGGFAIAEMTGFTGAWRVPCLVAADTSEVL